MKKILFISFFRHLNNKIDQKTDDITSRFYDNKITLSFLLIIFTVGLIISTSNIVIGTISIIMNNYSWLIIPGLIFSPLLFLYSANGVKNSCWRL